MLERQYVYARTGSGCLMGLLVFGVAIGMALATGVIFRSWSVSGACFVGIPVLLGRLVRETDQRARRKAHAEVADDESPLPVASMLAIGLEGFAVAAYLQFLEWNCGRLTPSTAAFVCKGFAWFIVVMLLGAVIACIVGVRRRERPWYVLACLGAVGVVVFGVSYM